MKSCQPTSRDKMNAQTACVSGSYPYRTEPLSSSFGLATDALRWAKLFELPHRAQAEGKKWLCRGKDSQSGNEGWLAQTTCSWM